MGIFEDKLFSENDNSDNTHLQQYNTLNFQKFQDSIFYYLTDDMAVLLEFGWRCRD